jgi:hypothetical protein
MTYSANLRRILAAGAACTLLTGVVAAAPIHFTGSLATDDAHFAFNFHLDKDTTLLANTASWAQGGFAPVLTLFGGAGGVQQASGSAMSCGSGSGAADPATGFCWDAVLGADLGAGNYTLVLTQDGNMANGDDLAAGFQLDGWTNYTSLFYLGVDGGPLCTNVDASQRSCNWALTIDGIEQAPSGEVPEPGSLALAGIALLALRRARSS